MGIKTPVSSTSFSHGFALKRVKILGIDSAGDATCDDGTGNLLTVTIKTMRAKGPQPAVNEMWYLSREMGGWTFAGIMNYVPNQGTATLLSGNTTVTITLPNTEPDANYGVLLSGQLNAYLFYTNRTTTSFVINASASPGANSHLTWQLVR